jgi:protein phosphatase
MVFKRRGFSQRDATEQVNHEVIASLQTDRGCVREVNEDAGRFFKPADPAVLANKGVLTIVADGMGGHLAGEVASNLAVEIISHLYYEENADASAALKMAFEEANRQIYEASLADENLKGMGTTCTALVLRNGSALAAHVGDSRLYLVREGELYLMTEDHSAVMQMVRHGIITTAEARSHVDKNVILRALGTTPSVEVSIWDKTLPVRSADRFILCSDGLYDLVEDVEIQEVMASNSDPQTACEELIALAKERGGHDNITVGVVSIKHADQMKKPASPRVTREVETAK